MKNKKLKTFEIRKLPIALLALFCAGLNAASAFRGGTVMLSSLADFALTGALFLALAAVFNRIGLSAKRAERAGFAKKRPEKPEAAAGPRQKSFFVPLFKKLPGAFKALKIRVKSGFWDARDEDGEAEPEPAPAAEDAELRLPEGLTEIKKPVVPTGPQNIANRKEFICSFLYVLLFVGIIVWRAVKWRAIMPTPYRVYSEYYGCGAADSILTLLFPFVSAIYLKMRKNGGARPADTLSRDTLTLFSYLSAAYAAIIAAASVLTPEALAVTPWIFYAALLYFLAAMAVNLTLAILKKAVIDDFNYTLFPARSNGAGKGGGFLDSDEIKMNFSLKSLYTIRYTLRILPGLVLALGAILLASTSVYVVLPHQQAAVYRLGKLTETSVVSQGLHFKLPWPVDKAEIADVSRVRYLEIGYESSPDNNNYLWTQEHGGGEYILLLGNGNETVAVNIKINYKISNLYDYVKTCAYPEALLSAAAYEALVRRTVGVTLDAFLSVDRSSLSASVAGELSAFCAAERLGLDVVEVIVENIHPPVGVAGVYQGVVSAQVDKSTKIISAESYARQALTDAQRQSKTAVDNARAAQFARVSAAQNETAVFRAAMEAYELNPECFELVKFSDAYAKVIAGNKTYIFSPGAENGISKSYLGKAGAFGVLGNQGG